VVKSAVKCIDAAYPLCSIDSVSVPKVRGTAEVLVRYRLVAISAVLILLPALAHPSFGQRGGRGGGRGDAPAQPTPRWPDGTVNWGAPIGEKGGLWNVAGGVFAIPDAQAPGAPAGRDQDAFPGKPTLSQVPFQPWARAIYDYRQHNQLEPYTRCKPSGGFRQVATAYGTQFVHFPELQQFIIFQTGGSHSYRTIYMDGRSHPKDLAPSYYGHSIGRFEGDTLVVDTIGYNERMWVSNLEGMPHTDRLHTIERFTRTDFNTIRYEMTIDDPGAYTTTWNTGWWIRFSPGAESFEFICQDNNKADEMMVGTLGEIDRSSAFVP
jgi:hypothetical protein